MDISGFNKKYSHDFLKAFESIEVSDKSGNIISFEKGISTAVEFLIKIQSQNQRVYIVGNGGSAGIAGHTAIDLWKNGGVPTLAFNDASLLTCLANDIGFEEVFSKPIEMFSKENDLVICISSSGNSQNIINACSSAKNKKCIVITLSGFDPANKLKPLGDLNFFVPAFSYGFVEIIHQYILHAILDAKLYCFDDKDVFNKNIPASGL